MRPVTVTIDGRSIDGHPLEDPIAVMVSRAEREHIDRLREASYQLAIERLHIRR